MPPTGDTAPVQIWRGTGLLLLGVLLGFVLTIGGEYMALRNPVFQNWLRNYFLSVSMQQFSQVASTTAPVQPLQSLATASTTIAVPKSYATASYYTNINNVLFDYNNMIAIGSQMAPLFVKLNEQTASGNYGEVIDLAIQIKQLIAQEKEIVTSFGQHLAALSTANQSSTDAVTKLLTQNLISSGNTFRDGLPPYFDALDGIFSGRTPSREEISRITALAQTTTDNLQSFREKLQLVLNHFKDASSKLN